jgi:hypothetical protein
MKIYIVILLIFCFGCNHKKDFNYQNLPDILENVFPSKTEDMFLNLNLEKPIKGISYIIQIIGNDTINIVQFDNQGRLTLKLYRQYVGEFWNDKYVTMVEGHIYSENKIKKSYFLHSNANFSEYHYSFSDNLVSKIKVYEKEFNGMNNNSNFKIKHISNLRELEQVAIEHNLNNEKYFSYSIERNYNGNIVTETRKNKNEKKSIAVDQFIFDNETKKLIFQTSNSSMFTYEKEKLNSIVRHEYNDTAIIIKKFNYNLDTTFITEICNGEHYWYTNTVNSNAIYFKSLRNFDTSNCEINIYECDKYKIPLRVTIKDTYEKDSIINIKTIYK